MGDSWRVGVDPEERTELVTGGPFELVRNPIYSAMLPTVFGLVLMVPSVLAIAAFVALVVALELQVRLVEEPYLLQVHGDAYADYAARVGRFVPEWGCCMAFDDRRRLRCLPSAEVRAAGIRGESSGRGEPADFAASLPPK